MWRCSVRPLLFVTTKKERLQSNTETVWVKANHEKKPIVLFCCRHLGWPSWLCGRKTVVLTKPVALTSALNEAPYLETTYLRFWMALLCFTLVQLGFFFFFLFALQRLTFMRKWYCRAARADSVTAGSFLFEDACGSFTTACLALSSRWDKWRTSMREPVPMLNIGTQER